ncbi:MAG: hypothetical protein P4L33_09695 [Capsulimonadaceae bacterium]|nr:hypothetical protein [Capsulimonadaceae bacterium]
MSLNEGAYAPQVVAGQPSWKFQSDLVEAYVTRTAGMLAPVTFRLGERTVQPYSIAPWAEEPRDPANPVMINTLRGDFFCAPFGGNDEPYDGVQYPAHGETANLDWTLDELSVTSAGSVIRLSLDGQARKAHFEKRLELRTGQTVVYSRNKISGASGPMDYGHHATLKFPGTPGCARISTSPFVYGQVCAKPFELAELGGYQSLRQAAEFTSLERVPMISGEFADLTTYPARLGFEDLLTMINEQGSEFAWSAAAVASHGYCWFALKDPAVLRDTILWLSNRGRHYAPWSSRHVSVLGIEETTSNFHFGIADSANPNPLTEKGFVTSVNLDPEKPLVVNYIQGVAAIGPDFDRVAKIERIDGGVKLTADSGASVTTAVDVDFLKG